MLQLLNIMDIKTELHYGSMNYYYDMEGDSLYAAFRKLAEKNIDSIKKDADFNEKPQYDKLRTQLKQKYPRKKKYSVFYYCWRPYTNHTHKLYRTLYLILSKIEI